MEENIKLPSRVVVDASIALVFLLPDESEKNIDYLFKTFAENKIKILVPEIFHFEVFNALKSAVLRKRINFQLARKLLKIFLKLKFQKREVDWLMAFQIAIKKEMSFYDASYLSLAKKENISLFTLDKLLLKKSEGYIKIKDPT